MFNQRFLISVLVVIGCCCAIPSSAALVTYASGAALTAATPDDTFQNIDVTAGSLGASFTDDGITFGESDGMTGVTGLSGFMGVALTSTFGAVSTITISFPSGVNAIEFDADGEESGSDVYVFAEDSDGSINPELVQSGSTPSFFGVTTTDSTFIAFSVANESLNPARLAIGDIMIGSPTGGGDPSPTPEAATLLLVATGLFAMGYFRRRVPGQPARRGTVSTISTGITPA
jgi:hypothetical protein